MNGYALASHPHPHFLSHIQTCTHTSTNTREHPHTCIVHRYDSISTFIYSCGPKGGQNSIDRYNDLPCEVDEELQVCV